MRIILSTLSVLTALWATAQVPAPGPAQKKTMVIVGGTLHVGDGTVRENVAIGIEGGKITFVHDAATVRLNPNDADIIKAEGKHIYPGFILPNTTLGLTEIEAVRATNDFREVGGINPNVRSIIAYNTDSKVVPTVRCNGVLAAQITPRGGLVSGLSSIVQLDAWNWEDAAVSTDDGLHVNWPSRHNRSGWWAEPGGTTPNDKYAEQVNELRDLLLKAKAYAVSQPKEQNLRLAACAGLFNGSRRLFVHVDDARSITESILLLKEWGIKLPVIVGGAEAPRVADFLKQHDVSVVLRRVHDLPLQEDDAYDRPYSLAAMLHRAGVRFCLSYEGDMEAMGARNLPFTAGTAVAFGLPQEEAVKAISLSAAQILGIDDRMGTVAPGKDATLFISTGDALDMRTNNLELALIQGRRLDLGNHQADLYRKFGGK
jgi:hypothetical protein